MRSVWLRVLLPQLLPLMVWPLVAVLSYGMTVVDMALVIGPTQPPTLATLIWRDLNDAERAINARGAAGVLLLSAMIICLLLVVGLLWRLGRPWIGGFYSGYPRTGNIRNAILGQIWSLWRASYGLVLLLLLLQSFSARWPFPELWPTAWTVVAWQAFMSNPAPLIASLVLALATATVALAASVAWFENTHPTRDRLILFACTLSLCLPALVIALGQYRLFLAVGITGTTLALFLAHVLPVSAYVFVMLHGPYRGFDGRWQAVSSGLMQPRFRFLTHIKWPMLKAPLLYAWAVGFAVSVAQFVPAQLAAAGRYSTLPMEAVTLSSGGNRTLIASHALMLTVLPLLVFLFTSFLGRPRWGHR
jgi:putative thiamine transport system permease protein